MASNLFFEFRDECPWQVGQELTNPIVVDNQRTAFWGRAFVRTIYTTEVCGFVLSRATVEHVFEPPWKMGNESQV